ncbi:Vacuolar protein sorting-associated protein 11 [Pestalotiopsis sp. IQ-011]
MLGRLHKTVWGGIPDLERCIRCACDHLAFPAALEDAIQINTDIEVPFSEGLYVGYKAYDKSGVEPLFPFGHGLTYSEVSLHCTTAAANDSAVTVRATLKNDGLVDARQVVRLYVGYPGAADEPPKLLRAFQKVEVAAGDSALVELVVQREDLMVWVRGNSRVGFRQWRL